ncbi:MAG: trypsin-like serine protease [Deltaproteobacteria bacterium]|nr:trypsin-like serine protease [Deltaproteobacteria bacterium]
MTRPTVARRFFSRLQNKVAALGFAALAPALAVTPAHAEENRIVGGQAESRWPAVGALIAEGDWFCTGTVIAPRVVLTAAHCLEGMSNDIEYFIGADANKLDAGRRIRVASVHPHPHYGSNDNYDVGIMLLAEDAGVTPVPARLAPLDQGVVGKTATFVGYGLYEQGGDGGEKRSVQIAWTEINDFFVGYQVSGKNTCNGDSGGPALMDLGNGLEVVGVTSYGDAACAENGYNTRSDVFADWIRAYVEGGTPDAGDIGPVADGGDDIGPSSDGGGDLCEELGWYGDDYCDEDCAKPDPDCRDGGDVADDDDAGDDDVAGWDGGDDNDSNDEGGAGWDDDGGDDDGDDNGNNDDALDWGADGVELGCSGGAGAGAPVMLALVGLLLAGLARRKQGGVETSG